MLSSFTLVLMSIFLFSCILALISSHLALASGISIIEFGDEMCTGGALVNQTTPAGTCYSGDHASGSARLWCIPPAPSTICASFVVYHDERCSSPSWENSRLDLVCGSCNGGGFASSDGVVACSPLAKTATLVQGCDFNAASQCANCSSKAELRRGQCVKIAKSGSGGNRFAKLESVEVCKSGVISIQEFVDDRTCSSSSSSSRVRNFTKANRGCDHGVMYECENK